MAIIVVEGVDASGKSTLLENARIAIKKRYFALARHSCRPLHITDVTAFLKMIESPFIPDIVVDRHPLISEPIYGPILRGQDLLSGMFDKDETTERLKKTVSRIVYCRPPTSVMLDNIEKNPQLEWVKERFHLLLNAYDKRMRELSDAGILVKLYSWPYYKGTLEDLFFGYSGGDFR